MSVATSGPQLPASTWRALEEAEARDRAARERIETDAVRTAQQQLSAIESARRSGALSRYQPLVRQLADGVALSEAQAVELMACLHEFAIDAKAVDGDVLAVREHRAAQTRLADLETEYARGPSLEAAKAEHDRLAAESKASREKYERLCDSAFAQLEATQYAAHQLRAARASAERCGSRRM